jgi:hypothetical protein
VRSSEGMSSDPCQSIIESYIKSQSFHTIIENNKSCNDPFLHVNTVINFLESLGRENQMEIR